MKEVSILIVTYNTAERITVTLDAIKENCKDIDYEVIVVDNASTDDTVNILQSRYGWIKLIKNGENKFYSPALNQAAKIADGKYILILNSDVTVFRGTINRLISFLKQNEEVGCIAPLTYNKIGHEENFFWKRRKIFDLARNRPPLSLIFKKNSNIVYKFENVSGENVTFPDVVSDACMLMRTKLFKDIGMYDENLLLYYTEDDLCNKIRKLGYKCAFSNSIKVHHISSLTVKKQDSLLILNIERQDQYYYFLKYEGKISALLANYIGFLEKIIMHFKSF